NGHGTSTSSRSRRPTNWTASLTGGRSCTGRYVRPGASHEPQAIGWHTALPRRAARPGGALGPPERLVQTRQAGEHPPGVAQRGRRRPRGDRAARDVGGDGGAGGEADRFGVNHLSEEQEGSTLFRGPGAGGRDPADGVVGGGRGAVRAAGGGVRVVAPGSGGVFGAVGEVPQARAIGRRLTRKQR